MLSNSWCLMQEKDTRTEVVNFFKAASQITTFNLVTTCVRV